jgi:hypothetical protein
MGRTWAMGQRGWKGDHDSCSRVLQHLDSKMGRNGRSEEEMGARQRRLTSVGGKYMSVPAVWTLTYDSKT